MPLTARQLTVAHRRQQLALRSVSLSEIQKLWPRLDATNLDGTYDEFASLAARSVAKNRRISTGLAASYLRASRVASGLDGNVRIAIPTLPPEQFEASLHSTSVAPVKAAMARGVALDVAMGNGLTLASGAMSRLVLNAGRSTVTETIRTDPRATGWRRVLGGGGCDFCQDLAGRVYPTDNADFEAHGKCGCTSEPVYD